MAHGTRTSLTLMADATMCTESMHMFASLQSRFSFRAWYYLALANSLNIYFMSLCLSLIRESITSMEERQVPAIADSHLQTNSVSLLENYSTHWIITEDCRVRAGGKVGILNCTRALHTYFLKHGDTLILKYLLYSKRLELLLDLKLKNIPWGYLRFRIIFCCMLNLFV